MSLVDAPVRTVMRKEVRTVVESKPLSDCVKAMSDADIGSLVVVNKDQTPVGIFTERDLVKQVAAKGQKVLGQPVSDSMNKPLTIISPTATIWDAITLMGRAKIRRLPVVENGRLVGILTETDVLRLILAQQSLLLESVSESFPAATREQLRGLSERFGLGGPPGRAAGEN